MLGRSQIDESKQTHYALNNSFLKRWVERSTLHIGHNSFLKPWVETRTVNIDEVKRSQSDWSTIGILQDLSFLCKLGLLLFEPRCDYQLDSDSSKTTPSCKWRIKWKYSDVFSAGPGKRYCNSLQVCEPLCRGLLGENTNKLLISD